MVNFLDVDTENKLRNFITVELAYKYQQYIEVEDTVIVTGLTGSDIVEEAIKVRFFIADSKVQWVEDKIASDIHRFCYENDIHIVRSPVIERDMYLDKIRYSLIYTPLIYTQNEVYK